MLINICYICIIYVCILALTVAAFLMEWFQCAQVAPCGRKTICYILIATLAGLEKKLNMTIQPGDIALYGQIGQGGREKVQHGRVGVLLHLAKDFVT